MMLAFDDQAVAAQAAPQPLLDPRHRPRTEAGDLNNFRIRTSAIEHLRRLPTRREFLKFADGHEIAAKALHFIERSQREKRPEEAGRFRIFPTWRSHKSTLLK